MSTAVAERAGMGVLPSSSDVNTWDEREQALAMQLGIAVQKRNGGVEIADRGTIEAFLAHCQRTQLDPIARQIYIIKRGSKWQTQISIDGARLVAERSGEYEGQTPVEWTADGSTWVQVWLAEDLPRAARAGVWRKGFRDPLYAVARWDSYAVYQDEWVNGRKTGNQVLSSMWAKMPDLMLGKVAEMLALRKAFPMDLSGLYSTEEMGQASNGAAARGSSGSTNYEDQRAARSAELNAASAEDQLRNAAADAGEVIDGEVVEEQPVAPAFDADAWALRIDQCTTVEMLRELWGEAQAAGVLGAPFAEGMALGDVLRGAKAKLEAGA